jgi:predicted metalloprotease with PDZ domain
MRVMTDFLRITLLVGAVFMIQVASAAAQTVDPIRYTLRFPAPHTHYVEVSAVVPTDGESTVDLMMAVWTPGSYLVREYARHVEKLTATDGDGAALAVEKIDKNHWRVVTAGWSDITVDYLVYAREMSVRTNWVEADFAMLNGAPTFLTLADGIARRHEVTIEPADGWARSVTGLSQVDGTPHRYLAPDFDTLVDSPIVVGNPAVYEFDVEGVPHYLVNHGENGVFDGPRAARDLETIAREHARMWELVPFEKYVFFNMLVEGRGGLEHRNSTLLMASRWATRTQDTYRAWLELASHEYFHTWNVKRLRPEALGPFDYDTENYTRSLWIVEGITDYYSDLAIVRAGLMNREEYLEALSNQIESLQTTPGRLVQSVEEASFDAWIKYYRQNENSVNAQISYYTKGHVLGLVLDAVVRAATSNARSLDDVMRTAYARYSGERGYAPDQFREIVEEIAGVSLQSFWRDNVENPGEVDYTETLETLGLRFAPARDMSKQAYFGINTRNDAGQLIVSRVFRDGPAYHGGLNVEDEILGIDDFRVTINGLIGRLQQYRPGDQVSVLVARRRALRRFNVTLGVAPSRTWRLETDPNASGEQETQRASWLNN